MNIPLLTTTRNVNKTELNSNRILNLFVAPLSEAIYSHSVITKDDLFLHSELLGVREILGRVFTSMYDNVVFSHYNFQKEFTQLVSKSLLSQVYFKGTGMIDKVFNLYTCNHFLEHENFEDIDYYFLEQLTEGLFSDSKLTSMSREMDERHEELITASDLPPFLPTDAFKNFDTEIRKSVADEFGLKYTTL